MSGVAGMDGYSNEETIDEVISRLDNAEIIELLVKTKEDIEARAKLTDNEDDMLALYEALGR